MTGLQASPFNANLDTMDRKPYELQQNTTVPKSGASFFTKKKRSSGDNSISNRTQRNIRLEIVDSYREIMQVIWVYAYIRQGAMAGNPSIYSLLDSSFDCIVCESVLADVAKLASVASNSIKQPALESINNNNKEEASNSNDKEQAISIANTYIDRLYYENINHFTGAFSSSLKSGIAFLHVDCRQLENQGVLIKQISPYRCIWDVTLSIHELHTGSFFLYEEYLSQNAVRDMYASNEAEEAMKVTVSEIDTFPTCEMMSLLDKNRVNIQGEKFSIDKQTYNLKYQIKQEVATNHHKLTTIYLRNKASTVDSQGLKSFKNSVVKFVYINNKLVDESTTNLEFIPIVGFCPLEEPASNTFREKYQSLFDCIRGELLSLAILQSSVSSTVLNNANSPIFIRMDAIADSGKTSMALKNRIISVKKTPDGASMQDIFATIPNQGIPQGCMEGIMLLKEKISQKLNIITNNSQGAKSADQEEIRISNQIIMSSSVIETLDRSILQFGTVIRDILKVMCVLMPEKIQENVQSDYDIIDAKTAKRMSLFLASSRVVLQESFYYTTKMQKDLTKLEKISQITKGRGVNISIHKLFETVGLSQELIDDVKKSTENAESMQEQNIKIENEAKFASIEKDKASTQELIAKAYKYNSDAKKLEAETNILETDTDDDPEKDIDEATTGKLNKVSGSKLRGTGSSKNKNGSSKGKENDNKNK